MHTIDKNFVHMQILDFQIGCNSKYCHISGNLMVNAGFLCFFDLKLLFFILIS